MFGIFRDRRRGRVVLQRKVKRYAVRGQRNFLRRVGAVVADVVPGWRPGNEGGIQLLEIFERGDGFLAVDDDIAFLIEQRGAVRPQQPVCETVAVADGVAEREARRLARLLQLATKVQQSGVIVGNLVKACRLHDRFAIHQRAAGGAERQSDPRVALVALAVFLGEKHPAAIALAEIVGDVGQFDQLVGIDMRRIAEADDDIGTGAAVRRHRGLLVDVFPSDEVDLDLDAHLLGEFRGVGPEHVFVGFDKPHRP